MNKATVVSSDTQEQLANLDDRSLLAALLQPTVGCEQASGIATRLLEETDLLDLAKEDTAYFEYFGIEPTAIAILTATFELSARLAESRIIDRPVLDCAEEVARFLVQRYRLRDQEVFGALFLDHGGRLISTEALFKGSGCACVVDPKLIMRRALLLSAGSLILWHNHPGGSTTPSHHDVEFTKKIARAAEFLNVRLLDHLVLAPDGRFTSMRRKRLW